MMPPRAAILAEGLGSGFIAVAVIGSGIMAERLCGGNAAIALLANALATVGALYVVILALAPISGAHFNPVITVLEALGRSISRGLALTYVAAQIAGAGIGAMAANLMFSLPSVQWSTKARDGAGVMLGEVLATMGLILCVRLCQRANGAAVPAAVAAYVGAAYWFTSSTSFANPAITLARALSDTFAGIAAASVGPFITMQLLGGALGALVARLLLAR